jgi:hypothetical protein
MPVTHEAAGSSPVTRAILAAFICFDTVVTGVQNNPENPFFSNIKQRKALSPCD